LKDATNKYHFTKKNIDPKQQQKWKNLLFAVNPPLLHQIT